MPGVIKFNQAIAGLVGAVPDILDLSKLVKQLTELLMRDPWSHPEQCDRTCGCTRARIAVYFLASILHPSFLAES